MNSHNLCTKLTRDGLLLKGNGVSDSRALECVHSVYIAGSCEPRNDGRGW